MDFEFKTEPFPYQRRAFERVRDLPAWGHFHEQGCGKTKLAIDEAAYLHSRGLVDRLLVVAPNRVHRAWVTDEIPLHMPDDRRPRCLVWESAKARNKSAGRERDALLAYRDGLAVLAITYDGIMTKIGRAFCRQFASSARTMVVWDEAHHCKSPGSPRAKAMVSLGKLCPYRRILTGTPVDEGPFDAYNQIRMVDPSFWGRQSPPLPTFAAFRARYGRWSEGFAPGGRKFPKLEGFRNLGELRGMLDGISDRLRLDDVQPDLPPRRFTRRRFELPAEWARVYRDLEETFMAELHTGEIVTAALGIVRSLRLHQIACGYVATDDGLDGQLVDLPGANARLELLESVVDGMSHQAIVWATWTRDVDRLCDLLGDRAARVDGRVPNDERDRAVARVRAGDAQFLVANPACAGEGLTILVPTMIYYSLGWKARLRNQSLARNRRHGAQRYSSLEVIDLIADRTIDEEVVDRLASKGAVAAEILGDPQ